MFARRLGNRARELLRVAARSKYSTIHLRLSLLLLYHPPLLLLLLLLLAPLLLPLFSSRFHLVFQSHHGVFFVASSPSLSFAISLFLTYSSLLLGPSFFPLLVLMPVPFSPSLFSEVCLPSTRNCLSFSLLVFSFSFLLSLSFSLALALLLFLFLAPQEQWTLAVGYIIGEVMLPPARASVRERDHQHARSFHRTVYLSCVSLSFSAFDASYSLLSYFLTIFHVVLLLYLVLRINILSYFLFESSTIDLLSLSLSSSALIA